MRFFSISFTCTSDAALLRRSFLQFEKSELPAST